MQMKPGRPDDRPDNKKPASHDTLNAQGNGNEISYWLPKIGDKNKKQTKKTNAI